MKIGIDIDDTITNTTEKIMEYVTNSGMDIDLGEDFCNYTYEQLDNYKKLIEKYIEPIFSSVSLKDDCVSVINKMKNDGNLIYIITARSNRYSNNVYDLTVEYLSKNGIIYDKLLFGYENKKDICIVEKIDYMIDDNISVYDSLVDTHTKPILFGKNNGKRKNVDSWNNVLSVLKEEGYNG